MVPGKKRNTKRGGKKNKNKRVEPPSTNKLKIFYNNVNGFMSKRESLNQIIKSEDPDIIALCETKLGLQSKPKISGYESEYLNTKRGKEGHLIAVKESLLMEMVNMTLDKPEEDRNIFTVQLKRSNVSIRIILAHAPQETDKLETRTRFFENLKLEVERGELSGDSIIVVGDMNGRVDLGDCERRSPNGDLLKEVIHTHKLQVANSHPNTAGKWTRIQKSKKGEIKSTIDYMLLDESLYNGLNDMLVDEGKIITPYWITTKKGVRSVVSSDHCAITATINIDIGTILEPSTYENTWKVTEVGLEKYKELTSTRTLFFHEKDQVTEMYRLWSNHLECNLEKCFKKKSVGRSRPPHNRFKGAETVRNTLKKVAVKGKIQREVVLFFKTRLFEWEHVKLETQRVNNLKDTLANFSEDEKTPPNAYWKVLKSVRGREKTKITSVMKNDGSEVFSENGIKQEAMNEFQHRLRNRQPAPGWEEYVKTTNKIVELLMNSKVVDGTDFTMEELLAAIKRLKKKKSPGPDGVLGEFLMEAGDGILLPLLEIFNKVKASKHPPDQWNNVSITIIYKNKGSRKSLVNYRGIFLASIVSKVFERLIKNRTKEEMESVNLCQAGARANRGPSDNIFILNAVLDHAIYLGKSVHVTAYDFEQAFDSLWLEDCILSLRKLGIHDYLLQLIYNLNKQAIIKVKTPYGPSPETQIKDTVQQGRVLAPDLCSASTAEYCGVNKGCSVGSCTISSLAFVDDMIDVSENGYDAENAHLEAISFSCKKKIKHNAPKCKAMVVNKQMNEKLAIMYIENVLIEHVHHLKYLGDIFQDNGKNTELIKDRISRGIVVILKIEAILADVQLGKHTLKVSLLLYRALFLSSVLFNSQAWRNLTSKDFADLQRVQLRLLKKLFDVPQSVSSSFLFLELGVLPIEYEIQKRQLTFLHHIVNLDSNDPVRLLYDQMKRLPCEANWVNDVRRSADKFSIEIDDERLKNFKQNVLSKRKHKL